ncbi:MAG: hypothetical protein KAG18_07920, partial [Sinobacterium sp.]|nr:hypothetical protein [Sinobacterium sp.]
MKILNRAMLMKAHTLLAAFILPVCIMFFVTGALYTWGIKGGYDSTVYEVQLDAPIRADKAELVAIAKKELALQGVGMPTGRIKIKSLGDSFKLDWAGSNMDVSLEPTSQPLVAAFTVSTPSLYRRFVQLHKAKGGTPFKVYAALMSAGLLLLL